MPPLLAPVVIREDLDDPTVADAAVRAIVCHPFHLAPEGGEPGDLAVDLAQVRACYHVRLGAGAVGLVRQVQQLPDRLDLEAEFARVADEAQPPRNSGWSGS